MNEKCLAMEKNIESLRFWNFENRINVKFRDVNVSLKSELDMMKKEYVFALQSTIRIPLKENSAMDTMQVKLLGGDVVIKLLLILLYKSQAVSIQFSNFLGDFQEKYYDSK